MLQKTFTDLHHDILCLKWHCSWYFHMDSIIVTHNVRGKSRWITLLSNWVCMLFLLGVYHCSTYMSNYANPMPINPETVRLEVQALKSDFNCRLKQIMFNAIVSTYYATFIPCVFVPNALSYETPWVFRHVSKWVKI